jgi:hypothetical protein
MKRNIFFKSLFLLTKKKTQRMPSSLDVGLAATNKNFLLNNKEALFYNGYIQTKKSYSIDGLIVAKRKGVIRPEKIIVRKY